MNNSQSAGYVWNHDDILSLIRIRSSLNYLFTGKRGSSGNAWKTVALNVRCGATAYQCKKKWENLQYKYKIILNPPTGKRSGEKAHGAHDWPYFEDMNKFMSSRHSNGRQSNNSSSLPSIAVNEDLLHQPSTADDTPPVSGPPPSCTSTIVQPSPSATSTIVPPSPPCTPTISRLSPSYAPESNFSYKNEPFQSPSRSPPCSSIPQISLILDDEQYNLTASPSCSTWSSSSSNSNQEPKRKRRRTASSTNKSIAELVSLIKEDLQKQERQREEARKIEKDLLQVLRKFLSKK